MVFIFIQLQLDLAPKVLENYVLKIGFLTIVLQQTVKPIIQQIFLGGQQHGITKATQIGLLISKE